MDACRREDIQATIEGCPRWYYSCDLPSAPVAVSTEYPTGDVHKSCDPGRVTRQTSDIQLSQILMAMVISMSAPGMGGMVSSSCYNQGHFQGRWGVVAVVAGFVQGSVDSFNDYFSISFNSVAIAHSYYPHVVQVNANFPSYLSSSSAPLESASSIRVPMNCNLLLQQRV